MEHPAKATANTGGGEGWVKGGKTSMKMKFVENDVNEVCNGNDMNGMCDYVME